MTLAIMTICSVLGTAPVDCIPPRPPIQDIPLMTTYFNPALGGLNCDIECGWMSLAPVTNEMYGYAAACPEELVGLDFTAVISHPAIGERACLDRGGDIGQILIYPGNLSTADKNQVGEYLSAYTGIAWTTIT